MNEETAAPSSVPCANSPRAGLKQGNHPLWLLGWIGLILWQGWLGLGLFGTKHPWRTMLDDSPVLSGRHPLHLYHGYLGARAFFESGSLSCYDPAFHAGYPKTPVFDSGSRPAELALTFVGASYRPSAYKISLFVICLLVPIFLYIAGRAAGLSRAGGIIVSLLGQLLWWSQPGQQAFHAGEVDLLLGAMFLMTQTCLLVYYHRHAGPLSLLGIVLTGLGSWFAHPLLSLLLSPLILFYYLQVGPRHRLTWHLPLLLGFVITIAANGFWLDEWIRYWWIRVPPISESPLLTKRTLQAFWELSLWGGGLNKVLICSLIGASIVGLVVLHRSGRRLTARLIGFASLTMLILAVAGTSWEPFARMGSTQLLIPALLMTTLPAAATLGGGLEQIRRWTGTIIAPLLVVLAIPGIVYLLSPQQATAWGETMVHPHPLEIGLGTSREALIADIEKHTTKEARILWEDRRTRRKESCWAALLPLLIDRVFVGGLDADAGIEHATSGLVDQQLAGQGIGFWSKTDLEDYCRRYNVGWVVCWTEAVKDQFASLGGTKSLTLPGGGWLLSLRREPSYALTGKIRWRQANSRGILLANAVPEKINGDKEGQIVLSLHYQAGMRVSPPRVRLERAVDSHDSIPFVRLRMSEPVGRILITWDGK